MFSSTGVSSARLGRIVEEAASEVYVFSAEDFRFRLVNKGARENLGYSMEELGELTPWDLKPEITRDAFLQLLEPLQSGRIERLDFDTVHQRKDGTLYNVAVKLQLFDEQGDRVFYAAIQDTTINRASEAALRRASGRLDAILANTTMAVFLIDERHHCAFMNRAAEELTGFAFDETIGRPLHDVIHHTRPDGSPYPMSECAIDRAFPENAREQGEEVFVRKDGSFYPVAYTASPVHDDGSRVVGTIIEVRDISADKRSEAARNLLMREVDHRARNVLAIVQSLAQLTPAPDVQSYKAALSGRINALARAQTSLASRRWEDGILVDVVRDAVLSLCPDLNVALDGPEVVLAADQVQPVSMVMHELATNANKYGACSQEGGKVTIDWVVRDGLIHLGWRETGGPAVVAPGTTGFGSKLTASLAQQLNGKVRMDWDPGGLSVALTFPLRGGGASLPDRSPATTVDAVSLAH